jgi:hypothetical protein
LNLVILGTFRRGKKIQQFGCWNHLWYQYECISTLRILNCEDDKWNQCFRVLWVYHEETLLVAARARGSNVWQIKQTWEQRNWGGEMSLRQIYISWWTTELVIEILFISWKDQYRYPSKIWGLGESALSSWFWGMKLDIQGIKTKLIKGFRS